MNSRDPLSKASSSHLSSAILWMMFFSGAAALGYEIVWMRMLTRAFGITVYAVSTLVAIYMGGLALGAHAASLLKKPRRWLRLYAWTETAAMLSALVASWAMSCLPAFIGLLGGEEPLSALARVAIAMPIVLPPTFFLGATLPILAHCWQSDEAAGRLYGVNTIGATIGLSLTAFWTIGAWGERAAIGFAAAFNAIAAVTALSMSQGATQTQIVDTRSQSARDPGRNRLIFWLFGLSGFCALGYEILWSRQLILLFGNSTYAFSILLLMYLAGIGIGSHAASRWRTNSGVLLERFGHMEWLLGVLILTSLAVYREFGMALNSPNYLYSPLQGRIDLVIIFGQAALMILPASLVMGMLFPVAVKLCSPHAKGDASTLGRLYAFNTVGGILGSLITGFWLIGHWGAHESFIFLALANMLIGCTVLVVGGFGTDRDRKYGFRTAKAVSLAIVTAALLVFVRQDPTLDILSQRLARYAPAGFQFLFHDESAAASITGISLPKGKSLLINGIVTAGTGLAGAVMEVLPHLLIESPKTTLIICFGAGNTFRTASMLGEAVDAVELVGDVVRRMPLFYPDADQYLRMAAGRVHIDDGRQYLLRTRRRYDSIIVDAAPPLFSSGAVNLYSVDFMTLVRDHLSPQGIFTLWMPLNSFEGDYWQILRSLSDVFPHVAVWTAPRLAGILFFGSSRSFSWPPGVLQTRIKKRLKTQILLGMTEPRLLDGFVLTEGEVRDFVKNYEPVTDDHPTTEFPLMNFLKQEPFQNSTDFILKAKKSSRTGT